MSEPGRSDLNVDRYHFQEYIFGGLHVYTHYPPETSIVYYTGFSLEYKKELKSNTTLS